MANILLVIAYENNARKHVQIEIEIIYISWNIQGGLIKHAHFK